ncbi:hypothetical protein [Mycolicibacterium holsaticum]|uniref:SnoaL-like domain-containing protein n=1 Tax=Mycolicibacterium holsaticum TaxID=152142 RepID=A0A1E3RTF7_9MYCO|nr:hypothetical protein [Mycolicibacterium holsaticum]ODQ92677.1 hypothetical protein BHQ17_16285 [Mycolicibacterium holsaticum]
MAVTNPQAPVHLAGKRSRETAIAHDKQAWLDNFVETYQCGNEEANVGTIVIRSAGYEVTAEGVFTYRVNDDGKLVALRAYWELDRATASARKI